MGISLKYDYVKRIVKLSIPDYVNNALARCQRILPGKPELTPYEHSVPTYGDKVQYEQEVVTADTLDKKEINTIQKIVGNFLYYNIFTNNIILPDLSDIAAEKSVATKNTRTKVEKLLNYLATNPSAKIQYYNSSMVLHIHAYTSYLSVSKARSRVGVFSSRYRHKRPIHGPL